MHGVSEEGKTRVGEDGRATNSSACSAVADVSARVVGLSRDVVAPSVEHRLLLTLVSDVRDLDGQSSQNLVIRAAKDEAGVESDGP